MLSTQLPPTDTRNPSAFDDVPGCERWLSQLQLTNIQAAHQAISGEIEKLNRYALPPAERLAVLEALRETAVFVQSEYAKRLAGKPLPLNTAETAALNGVISLWQAMITGYQHCLQACLAGEPALTTNKALICQRCMCFLGQLIQEYYRVGYEFDPELWRQLHRLYAFTEEHGIAPVAVQDSLNTQAGADTCGAAYIKTVLICQANPYELSRKQLQLIDRWLTGWSAEVSITPTLPPAEDGVLPLMVDLNGSGCTHHLKNAQINPGTRYLDMSALSKLLRTKSALLRQGQSPVELELGTDCVQPACSQFLTYLHQQWCEGRFPRFFERQAVNIGAEVCYGLAGIHLYVQGKPFKQPRKGGDLTADERKQLAAFGHVVSKTGRTPISEFGVPLETWKIQDQSALGMRILRDGKGGERLAHTQIVGVRPADSDAFVLGVIRWIMVNRDGFPQAGVRTLPGLPQPIALRAYGLNVSATEPYVQAFLLPQVPALQTPPSLVMPSGWFKSKRVVETFHNQMSQNVKLEYLIEKGLGYERASFVPA